MRNRPSGRSASSARRCQPGSVTEFFMTAIPSHFGGNLAIGSYADCFYALYDGPVDVLLNVLALTIIFQ